MEDEWDDELLSKIDDLESLHLQAAAERQAAQQTQQTHQQHHAAEAIEAQWACQSCTLLNAASRATCLVCSTPRGQAFRPTASDPGYASEAYATSRGGGAYAGVTSSSSMSQATARKTVQATLPFAAPARPATATPAQSPQPVPAPPTTSPFWPLQQQPQHRNQQQQQQSRAAFPVPNRSPPALSRPTQQQQQLCLQNPARDAVVIDADDDDLDDPEVVNAVAWPIAYATLQRRSGEDAQAKTRYLDVLNRSLFPEIDYEAAQHFVYPTNYPIREYQLTISEKALYHNTMVSLPTGLGKTLIASVVMYNFYKWFPQGKIVFMAPTKPLVAQQIKACHEIMGIPLTDTAELQGNVPPSTRKVLWRQKRVFFCTPQSMQNDLRHGICEAERFVCLVIDEAHRATGNYAYCCVIQEIEKKTPFFRVLALSATPGAKFEIIQDVIKNLRISHIESRSADDPDVKKYTHARQEEVIKCTLSSQITEVKDIFLKVFKRLVHRLVSGNIIQHRDPEKLSRWYVLQMRENFRKSPNYQANRAAESDLALLVSLLHAKDLLTAHGLSSFQEYVNGWIEERESGARLSWSKKEMLQSAEFHSLVLSLNALGTDYSSKSANGKSSSSHPKLLKLREVLHEHFQRHSTGNSSTRAIVFTQYRTSVMEIVGLLEQMVPLIKVQAFVGQGASGKAKESKGQSQKQQQEIVKKFRNGEFNVLVATCIAEEGLDIGEVDLIVSFDALTSPVRMIQRMGRTGRKRVGKVIILVTEGDEEKKLARSVASAKTVARAMTTFKSKFIYSKCPRMIPNGIQPELSKLEMLIPEFHASQVGGKQRMPGQATRQRQLENGEESARRRWQLNDIEKAIGVAKYFPSDLRFRPRNPIFPVVARPRHLLRRTTVSLRGKEQVESDTFQVGHSTRSAVLRQLVRNIHGVVERDEEVVEIGGDANQSSDDDSPLKPVVVASTRPRLGSDHTQTDTQRDQRFGATDFSFSAAEMVHGTAKTGDDMFGSQEINFSPEWNDAMSPVKMNGGASSEKQVQPPIAKPTPTPAAQAPSPQRPMVAALVAEASPKRNGATLTSPDTKSKAKPVAKTSPARRAAQPALSSPITKTSKKEKGKRGASSDQSSKESAASAAGAKEFERGELLLQRLRDLIAESQAASAELPCSPELDARHSTQETASQSTKALPALPIFPRITRITRRLDFEAIGGSFKASTPKENCVPDPPSDSFPATFAAPVPRSPSPELSPEDEPVFTLLPELSVDHGHEDVAKVIDKPELSEWSKPKLKEPSKPKRSLALKKSVHYLEDDDDDDDAPLSRAVPVAGVAQAHALPPPPPAARANPVPAVPVLNVKIFAPPTSVKPAPVVLEIEDFDDLEEEVQFIPQSAAQAATPAKKQKAAQKTPERRESPLQKRSFESTQRLATQSDCCSVCTEVESYEDDPIVYCDGCDLGVHQFCYGIASLPSGNWFCDSCVVMKGGAQGNTSPSCDLCPLRGGALKRTLCGRWAHVQCFMWLPELQLVQDRDVLTLGSLKNLDPDRNTLDCSLCHSRKGRGIIQCAHKRCMDAFHVSCACFAQYKLSQEEQEDGGETLFLAYCPLHRRKKNGAVVQEQNQQKPAVPQQQRTPVKPTVVNPPRNSASPSALFFSPVDQDSAKKFRKFRRLKRKYEASQSQQSPSTLLPAIAGAATTTGSGDRRSSWGKRVKRSQQYSEGRKKQAVAMARMFIEDDVEVHGDGDDDDDDDDDMDGDEANELEDSFINDSSQLIYSPASPPDSAGKDGHGAADGGKKRKRSSPGDMRAIYARSLLESQDVMPAFMRRVQRDFGALPQNGIINACLQELRNPPPPPSSGVSPSSSSLFSPQSVRSRDDQESPLSLVSPAGRGVDTQATTTPSTGARKLQRRSAESRVAGVESKKLRYSMNDDGDDDDFESSTVEPPSFSLLSPAVQQKPAAVTPKPVVSTTQRQSQAPSYKLPPEPKSDTENQKTSSLDEDRTLQERIEANRLKALKKLRERQLKMAQSNLAPSLDLRNVAQLPPQMAVAGGGYGHPIPHMSSAAAAVQASTPSRAIRSEVSRSAVAAPSQDNAVPEAPSFSLFPSSFIVEPIQEAPTSVMIDLTEDVREPQQRKPLQQVTPQPPIAPLPSVRHSPSVVIHVNSGFSQSQLFPSLISSRPLECAVEIEDSLEADVLVSAQLAVIVLSLQEFAALERQQRPGNDLLASHPRVQSCLGIFKKMMVVIQVGDGTALQKNPNLQRLLRQHTASKSSNANVEAVVRANDEQLCRYLFDTAKYVFFCG